MSNAIARVDHMDNVSNSEIWGTRITNHSHHEVRGVDILVRPFVNGAHFFDVKHALPQAICEQFRKDSVEIPHQKIVVHNAK